jgi:hypothetical protein
LTSIAVVPATVTDGTSSQLSASATDQFGNILAAQPSFTWALVSSGNGSSLTPGGLYTAPNSGSGSDTVQAAAGGVTGTGTVTFAPPAPPAAPTGLTAIAGNAQVALSWNASAGASYYQVFRVTTPGTESSSAPIATVMSGTSFADTGLTNGVTYYYEVSAVNSGGSTFSSEVSATPTAPVAPGINIDSGGNAVGSFVKDTDFSGGSSSSTGHSINTSGVTNPAPQAVYQTWRAGSNFTYTIPNLTAGASYTVRLDFSENVDNRSGQRLFNVSINGAQVLTNFDIFKTAGSRYKAIAEQFTATADSTGKITIKFTAVTGNAIVNGIEITAVSGNVIKHASIRAAFAPVASAAGPVSVVNFLETLVGNSRPESISAAVSPATGHLTTPNMLFAVEDPRSRFFAEFFGRDSGGGADGEDATDAVAGDLIVEWSE